MGAPAGRERARRRHLRGGRASRTRTSATCSRRRIDPIRLDPIHVEEPTMSVVFAARRQARSSVRRATSSAAGRSRSACCARRSPTSRCASPRPRTRAGMEVAGRGVLHLSVLMETMRREGYEFQVGRPQVILKKEGGKTLEPIELAVVDVPREYAGKVIEIFGRRGGEMTDMVQRDEHVHLEFKIAVARRHGAAHPHPQRHARRGHALPPLHRNTAPTRARSADASERLDDRDVHRRSRSPTRSTRCRRAASCSSGPASCATRA